MGAQFGESMQARRISAAICDIVRSFFAMDVWACSRRYFPGTRNGRSSRLVNGPEVAEAV